MCATIIPKGVRRDMYIKRDIEKILLEAAESFQVITIYGSRQVGKSTTVDQLFGDSFETVTLDDAEELDMALSNPRAFFESHPWPLIIDEVQKAVGLLSEIKKIVDEQRRTWMKNNEPRRLMFVLTGSNQFELQEGISESLAGRTAVINMSGFTQTEKRGISGALFTVDLQELLNKQRDHKDFYRSSGVVFEDIFQGGMPDICTGESKRDIYYKAYIDTYIEKDASINDEIDKLRHSATAALYERKDVIIVSSVSCIYGLGDPIDYENMVISLRPGMKKERNQVLKKLITMQYTRNEIDFKRGTFRAKGDIIDIIPVNEHSKGIRIELFGDEIDAIKEFDPLTGSITSNKKTIAIFPASHFVTSPEKLKIAIKNIREELEERLKSRLTFSLPVDIFPPDFDLRCEIIKAKIKSTSIENKLNNDVIEFIEMGLL